MEKVETLGNFDNDSTSSSESCLGEIGFMFDAEQETKSQVLRFSPKTSEQYEKNQNLTAEEIHDSDRKVVTVIVDCVDDDPGAVQSGHYLWPGAPALAQFLVDIFSSTQISSISNSSFEKKIQYFFPSYQIEQETSKISIIELGAGCGLAGLTALQLPTFQSRIAALVFTDHDPGTLKRARDNYNNTLQLRKEESNSSDNIELDKVPVFFEDLTWGDEKNLRRLCCKIKENSEIENHSFDIILGSDLIYCEEVVKPLLESVSWLMHASGESCSSRSIMIMTQSFSYDIETEEAIDRACYDLSLNRSILTCNLNEGGTRIQSFTSN